MASARLFHKDGLRNEEVFQSVLVLQKRCSSLAKLILSSILQYNAFLKIFLKLEGQLLLTRLNVVAFMHWQNLPLAGNQFIRQNCIRNM